MAKILTPANPPNDPLPERLSAELAGLALAATGDGLTFREIFVHLQGRIYPLLLVFIALPFCQPIALPGLSTPFGVVIGLLGLRFALQKKPWLPERLMNQKIPATLLIRILNGGAAILRWIEKFLHPRAPWVFEWRMVRFVAGCGIAACGALLLLPLPVPLTNFFPALAVVLAASAISERDGYMLIASGVVFVIACFYIGLIFLGGVEAIEWINSFLFSRFRPE